MAGFPVLGPIEHSVLEMTLDGGHSEMTIDEEPLAHSVLDVALDGRPIEGIPVPEPLEHSVLGGPGQRTHGGDVTFRTVMHPEAIALGRRPQFVNL